MKSRASALPNTASTLSTASSSLEQRYPRSPQLCREEPCIRRKIHLGLLPESLDNESSEPGTRQHTLDIESGAS
jgi:hypothetical protein